jgi:hypothetical protein
MHCRLCNSNWCKAIYVCRSVLDVSACVCLVVRYHALIAVIDISVWIRGFKVSHGQGMVGPACMIWVMHWQIIILVVNRDLLMLLVI